MRNAEKAFNIYNTGQGLEARFPLSTNVARPGNLVENNENIYISNKSKFICTCFGSPNIV